MFLMCESLRFAYVVVTTRTDSAITGPITCSFSSVVVSAAVDVVSGGAAIAAPRAGGCCSTSGSAASSPRSSTTEERMSSVVGTSSDAMAVRVVEWLQLYVCGYSGGTAGLVWRLAWRPFSDTKLLIQKLRDFYLGPKHAHTR